MPKLRFDFDKVYEGDAILQIIPAQDWCASVMEKMDSDGNDVYSHAEVICWALMRNHAGGGRKFEYVIGMLADGPKPADASTSYHKRGEDCVPSEDEAA